MDTVPKDCSRHARRRSYTPEVLIVSPLVRQPRPSHSGVWGAYRHGRFRQTEALRPIVFRAPSSSRRRLMSGKGFRVWLQVIRITPSSRARMSVFDEAGTLRHGEEAGFQSGKHFIDAGFDVGVHIFIRPLKRETASRLLCFFSGATEMSTG